jgi:uncharacterized protein (TIGR02266 family)
MPESTRQHPRVVTNLEVEVRTKDGGPVTVGRIRNTSLGGVFIEMKPLSFGTELELTFSLPGVPTPLSCAGYVVWSTKEDPQRAGGMQGNGIRLANLSVADMRHLQTFVRKKLDAE